MSNKKEPITNIQNRS